MSMMCVRASRGMKLTRNTPFLDILTVLGTDPRFTMISSCPSPAAVTSTKTQNELLYNPLTELNGYSENNSVCLHIQSFYVTSFLWRYLLDSQMLHNLHKFSKIVTKFWIRIKWSDASHRCPVYTNNTIYRRLFLVLQGICLIYRRILWVFFDVFKMDP